MVRGSKVLSTIMICCVMLVTMPTLALASTSIKVKSPGIENGYIAKKYGFQNGNISLPLTVTAIPKKARYLAVLMRDQDNGNYVHWIATNISKGKTTATKKTIKAGASKSWAGKMKQGLTSGYVVGYEGPWPPETHTYSIMVYALKSKAAVSNGFSMTQFKKAIKGKVVSKKTIKAKYSYTIV